MVLKDVQLSDVWLEKLENRPDGQTDKNNVSNIEQRSCKVWIPN